MSSFLFSALLLPLLAGYIFILSIPYFKLVAGNQSGYHLILNSTALGVILVFLAYYFILFCEALLPGLFPAGSYYAALFADIPGRLMGPVLEPLKVISTTADKISAEQARFLAASTISLLFSFSLFMFKQLLDRVAPNTMLGLSFLHEKQARLKIVLDEQGGHAEALLAQAWHKQSLVLVTLKSRKVYVGRVLDLPEGVASPRRDFVLMPFATGHRRRDTLELNLYKRHTLWSVAIDMYKNKELREDDLLEEFDASEKIIHQVTYEQAKRLANDFRITIFWDDIETIANWLDEMNSVQNPMIELPATLNQ